MKTRNFSITLLFLFIHILLYSQENVQYNDTTLSIELRAADFIGQLTLKEKISLLLYKNPAIERLEVPAYNWWNEALHGIARAGKATVFPQAIALAATFDTKLIHEIATAIANEARAKHQAAVKKRNHVQYTGLTFWSPNINIFRDPRWGRGQETYGEDPFLTSQIAVAFITGLQGNDPTTHLKTAACAKHFAVHSGPEESRHRFNAKPDETDLYETYLPAFKTSVNAGVEAIMCAYNRLFNEPCCANRFLLDTLLRQQWDFRGHVVSDCWALDDIWARHKVADNKIKAAAMAAKAGVNLNCGYLYKYLPEAIEKGFLTEMNIDSLLLPLIKTRIRLGILTNSDRSPYNSISKDTVHCKKHVALAKQAADESIVLLKNNGILPIDRNSIKNIFVTGPTAMDNMVLLGNYNGFSDNLVTFLEGIIDKVDAGTIVNFSQGMMLTGGDAFNGTWQASQADVTFAFIGNSRLLEGENGDAMLNKNGGDRVKIELPESQVEFIKELRKKAGKKPLIVVITGGSAVAIPEIEKLADAILFAWYPGEQGGNALADIIFGNVNPSGRLPVTFYQNTKDLPPFESYDMTGRTYRYFTGKPLYEFGYGLSYSDFTYSGLKTNNLNDTLFISFSITNIGPYEGDEVAQVYISEKGKRMKKPNESLKGFTRIRLKKGETVPVIIPVPYQSLKIRDIEQHTDKLPEKGLEVRVGTSSSDIRLQSTVTIK